MKNEEYTADFCLVSRRTLNDDEFRIFRFHFLLGADWSICCKKLNMERGDFYHEVYRIQQKLGRTFRELEPHALFPLDEYFNGTPRSKEIEAGPFLVETEAPGKPLRVEKFPLKQAA